MSTSILEIIPAGSKATKVLASGKASGRKNIATRKGTMIGALKKLTPAKGKRLSNGMMMIMMINVKTNRKCSILKEKNHHDIALKNPLL